MVLARWLQNVDKDELGGALQDRVAIVVLNWNGWKDTQMCLSSLRQLNYNNYEVIVVDNGSSDDSVDRIRSDSPEVTIIENGENRGFAGGCNAGIGHALSNTSDFVWLLNNDTIVDPEALRRLVDKAREDRRIAVVGSAIYFMEEPHSLQAWGGGRVNFCLGRSRHFLAPVRDDAVDFITGARMLVSREGFESVGLLDEQFFMYWEDADLCFRVRKAKWKLAVAGDSRIWHKGSASVGKNSVSLDRYFNTSAAQFFRRHATVPFVPLYMGGGLRLAKRALNGDWRRIRAVWAGITQERTSS
jgi:GT2 family glycosyltransferase